MRCPMEMAPQESEEIVDAIVRFTGHTYTGVSSSPLERVPEFTPPIPDDGNPGTS